MPSAVCFCRRDFCFCSALGWAVWGPGPTSLCITSGLLKTPAFSPWPGPGCTPTFLPNLLYSLQQALKSPQVSSSHHPQVRVQKDCSVTSYFIASPSPFSFLCGSSGLVLSDYFLPAEGEGCLQLCLGLDLFPALGALGDGRRARQIQSLRRSPVLTPPS